MSFAAALAMGLCLTGCNRAQMPPPQGVPEVGVVAIQPQQVTLTSELPGRTTAFRIAEIRPQVNGLVKKRLFTEGSQVTEGEVLYEIDPKPYQAAYDSAAANLASMKEAAERARTGLNSSIAALKRHQAVLKLATTNGGRYERMLKSNAVSAMEHDQAMTDVEIADASLRVAEAQVESDRQSVNVADAAIKQAEAALETAEINLNYAKITAPITGRIGRSNVTEGAIATAYQPAAFATIQQIDPIYVDVPQSTVELHRLQQSLANGDLTTKGTDKVKVILEDGTVYQHEGSLQFRDVTVDQTTGSVILRIVVPNPDGTLLPGMFVRAIVEEGIRDDAILVPQQAVSRDPKGNPLTRVVVTVDGEDAQKQKIKKDVVEQRELVVDRAVGDKWLVSKGLEKGDRVVVEGVQKIRPGGDVKVVRTQVGESQEANSKDSEASSKELAANPKDTNTKATN
jgi:membrane fusion protein (multidrug efflux system)